MLRISSAAAKRRLGAGLGAVSRAANGYGSGARMDSTSTMHDNDPEVLEREKERSLAGQQFGNPGWNEVLASSSEAHVKADKDTSSTIELTSRTVDYVLSKYDPDNRNGATATWSKDEVSGPLSGRGALDEAAAAASDLASKASSSGEEPPDVLVHEGRVIYNRGQPGFLEEELEEDARMTDSERNVKSDRGELI